MEKQQQHSIPGFLILPVHWAISVQTHTTQPRSPNPNFAGKACKGWSLSIPWWKDQEQGAKLWVGSSFQAWKVCLAVASVTAAGWHLCKLALLPIWIWKNFSTFLAALLSRLPWMKKEYFIIILPSLKFWLNRKCMIFFFSVHFPVIHLFSCYIYILFFLCACCEILDVWHLQDFLLE